MMNMNTDNADNSRRHHGYTVFTDYDELLNAVAEFGHMTGDTKALFNVVYDVDVTRGNPLEDDRVIVYPQYRGNRKTSTSYATTELAWYKYGTRRANEIGNRAKMWFNMMDDNGLVNSNYGYQLRASYGKNFVERFAGVLSDRIESQGYGTVDLNLLNPTNMLSTNDLMCNNKVTLSCARHDDGYVEMVALSSARSIDLITGLPYDMIALQYLAHSVARAMRFETRLTHAQFFITNVHLYMSSLVDWPFNHSNSGYLSALDYEETRKYIESFDGDRPFPWEDQWDDNRRVTRAAHPREIEHYSKRVDNSFVTGVIDRVVSLKFVSSDDYDDVVAGACSHVKNMNARIKLERMNPWGENGARAPYPHDRKRAVADGVGRMAHAYHDPASDFWYVNVFHASNGA